jgi:nucleoside-diphosphate-sugar epimerase
MLGAMSATIARRVLLLGCGYVGLATGRRLVEAGHTVSGLRRSAENAAELRAAGIRPLVGDITLPAQLAALPGPFDWVVNTVSSSRGGAAEYRSVYLEGTRNVLAWLATQPVAKFVYTSSTSVYPQNDAGEVDETSPAQPAGETGRLLRDTEEILLAAARERHFPAVILRVAGIYGPGRGHLFHQLLVGEARVAGDGSRLMNMVHRDDVAAGIVTALEHGQPGEIYNCTDDLPVSQLDFLAWCSAQLGRPVPPFATELENNARKRGLTNKRVSNRKLRALGWSPRHPSYREGYAAALAAAQIPATET